jgi:putative ABC transport system ATP-binding protein
MALLEIRDLKKSYTGPDGGRATVLDLPELVLEAEEQVALRGVSGSGKTTLLHLIAGVLRPDTGSILLDGVDLAALSERRRDALRARSVGYVFQTFNLLQGFSALENVVLATMFGGGDERLARELLEELGLGDRLRHKPGQLSVGQQQRVALARALANRPRLVLADEPTGNLDPERALQALELIRKLCREHGAALLCVSHDPAVLGAFERTLSLEDLTRAPASPGGAA